MILTTIIGVALGFLIAWPIARMQDSCIKDCLALVRQHDKVFCGELNVKDISSSELMALNRPMFTVVGMGGMGPRYEPSFDVFSLVIDELRRRREL